MSDYIIGILLIIFFALWIVIGGIYIYADWTPLCSRLSVASCVVWVFAAFANYK